MNLAVDTDMSQARLFLFEPLRGIERLKKT